jgi:isoleucyl-tRNA synthetase
MATLQRVVELGRAARAASKVKTRQPLPEVLVRVPSERELRGLQRLEEALRDELNVKAVRYLATTDPFLDYDLRPNLPKVGKRLGKHVPAVRAALAAADGAAVARAFAAGEPITLNAGGESWTFTADELLLDARSPAGYAAVEDRGALAALRIELTPELLREGIMRDAVRLVQDARKQAGLGVADRISLTLESDDPEVRSALEAHRETLAHEVLATELAFAAPRAGAFTLAVPLGAGTLTLSLVRPG